MSLREATAVKHKEAESHPFNVRLLKGELTNEQYVLYLDTMADLFSFLENNVEMPESMLRVDRIHDDIEELNPNEDSLITVLDSMVNYLTYLSTRSEEELMAHVYLNYLALAFGGQTIKGSVPGSGRMYDFDNVQEVVGFVRSQQRDDWADEVNKGFDHIIAVYDELQGIFGSDSRGVSQEN